jgi:hypothetical protein
MVTQNPSRPSGPLNPTIHEIAPDVVNVAPDYATCGVVLENFDGNAQVGVKTMFDWPDAIDLALRLAGAAIRLRRLTP